MNFQDTRFRDQATDATGRSLLLDQGSSFLQRTATVAAAAAADAETVDREACFPRAAIDAARREKLLGMQIPQRIRRPRRIDP